MKKHNFYAGPSILPEFTKEKTAEAMMNFAGTNLSIMEISHRSKEFIAVMDEAIALVKDLLKVPDTHEVLFLQGGASSQFYMVPFNLMKGKAAYINTGTWATKAIKEAKMFGEVVEVASSKDANFTYIPKGYEVPADCDYFHFTSNNTIFGTQTKTDPEVGVPLVADMSSDIFCRPIDVSKYDVIYAGAQKNLAPSGVTLVIVRKEALGKVDRPIPTMIDYTTHIDKGSMFNTPPCVAIFAALQTLTWLKENGGIEAMYKRNVEKAELLYAELDRNSMFEPVIKDEADRSIMNVTFVFKPEFAEKEAEFMALAAERNIVGIKGHRSVGGFRASIYNAMPIESVQVLVDAMKDFEGK